MPSAISNTAPVENVLQSGSMPRKCCRCNRKHIWKLAHACTGASDKAVAALNMNSYNNRSCCGSRRSEARMSAVNRRNVTFRGDGDGGGSVCSPGSGNVGRRSRMVNMSRPGRMSATQSKVANGIDKALVRAAAFEAPAGTNSPIRPC